jgi:hypothetical protein
MSDGLSIFVGFFVAVLCALPIVSATAAVCLFFGGSRALPYFFSNPRLLSLFFAVVLCALPIVSATAAVCRCFLAAMLCACLLFQQPPPFVVVFCSRALRPAYCFSNRRRVSSDCSDCHQSRRNNVTYWFRINLDVPDSLQI